MAVATVGALLLSLGAWASHASAEGDEPAEPAPTTTVVVAVGLPPVPVPAVPAPLANRKIVEVTSTRVVDDAVRTLSAQLDELAELL